MSKIDLNVKNEDWKQVFEDGSKKEDISRLLPFVIGQAEGYFFIASRGKGTYTQKAFHTSILNSEEMLLNAIGSSRFNRSNLYFSLCTYVSDEARTEDNLLAVNGFAVDVDYHNGKYRDTPIEQALLTIEFQMEEDGLPLPNYIEYGRNFRLVWIFEKPFIIPKNLGRKQRQNAITFLKRIGKMLNDRVKALDDWGVDDFKLHPFVRVPHSVNRHFTEVWIDGNAKYLCDGIYEVNIKAPLDFILYSTKTDFDKFADTILPNLPSWYDEWKDKPKKQKKPRTYKDGSLEALCKRRIHDLEELQKRGYGVGFREKLCWLYGQMWFQLGLETPACLEKMMQFNDGFDRPLLASSVRAAKPVRLYKIKDKTIRECIGLDDNEQPDLFSGKTRHDRYVETLEGRQTKSEKIAEICLRIQELKNNGYSDRDIMQSLNIPKTTFYRYKKQVV